MPTYEENELSEHAAEQTFLFRFVSPLALYHWTNAPLAVIATIDGDDTLFVHPRGGIAPANDPTESPDAARSGLDISVSHLNPIIRAHREFPPPGDMEVDVWRQNEINGVVEHVWGGVVMETPIENSEADGKAVGVIRCQHVAELVSGSEGLSEKWAPTCPFMTYQHPCPARIANHSTTVTVVDIDVENFTVEVSGITQSDDWFRAGVFACANGDKRFILDHTGNVLTLLQNFPRSSLKVGDDATLIDGDDHLYETCSVKFGAETGGGAAFGGNHIQANKNVHQIGRVNVNG